MSTIKRLLQNLHKLIIPNQPISNSWEWGVAFGWGLLLFLFWSFVPSDFLPRPAEVFSAFGRMWFEEGLGQELITSFTLQLAAVGIAIVVSLTLAYLATVPLIKPVVVFIATCRFISLSPLILMFGLLLSSDAMTIRISTLVFSISVFYIPDMLSVVLGISNEELEHARTLRMGPWRVVWETAVIGKAHVAYENLRKNAAIGWIMLTMVEGLTRGYGGVGVMLLNEQKHFMLDSVAVVLIVLFIVGLSQDLIMQWVYGKIFPFANYEKERR